MKDRDAQLAKLYDALLDRLQEELHAEDVSPSTLRLVFDLCKHQGVDTDTATDDRPRQLGEELLRKLPVRDAV